jgi:hypothetical protein
MKVLGTTVALIFGWHLLAFVSRPGEEAQRLARRIAAVTVVRIPAKEELFRFSPAELARFQLVLRHSQVSNSLASQGPEWKAALVASTTTGKAIVLHPLGSVLRVNGEMPYSASPANKTGVINLRTIQDLLLQAEDAVWLEKLLTGHLGQPTNREYRRFP